MVQFPAHTFQAKQNMNKIFHLVNSFRQSRGKNSIILERWPLSQQPPMQSRLLSILTNFSNSLAVKQSINKASNESFEINKRITLSGNQQYCF